MVKFDKLLNNAGIPLLDSGMLAVYDLILVTLANNFSACAKTGDTARAGVGRCSKSDKNICRSCNHLGKFAALALMMRKESSEDPTRSTLGCWPQE